jgi:hypothetical protein
VRSNSTRRGLAVGTLAASATAGALVGFGLRQGTPSRPFNAIAQLVLRSRAEGVWGFDPTVTLTGVALHVISSLALGVVCLWLAERRGGIARVTIAFAIALAALAAELLVIESMLGAGMSGTLTRVQIVVVHVMLAIALAVGMRLASPPP